MISPVELIRDATKYSIGLATEVVETKNRQICLSNKIFTYLGAGIPVVLSNTPGQALLSKELGQAALLVELQDTRRFAQLLDEFLSSPSNIEAARVEALRLAYSRYNWDFEKAKFLSIVEKALG